MSEKKRMRRRTALLAAGLVVGATTLAACAAPPETSYVDETGRTVTVNWKDYPAAAGYAAEDVLELPTAEQVETRCTELFDEIRAALEAEYELSDWYPREASGDAEWFAEEGNGYGGKSMLTTFNSQTWVTETDFPRDEWEHVVGVIAEVAARYGIDGRALDEVDADYAVWSRSESLSNKGEWLSVTVQDARLDPTGKAIKEFEASDWFVSGLSFSYGVTTIRRADRVEFKRRAAPFAGLAVPAATRSD